jgi:hypothetical protein
MNDQDLELDEDSLSGDVAEKRLHPEGWTKPPTLMELKQELQNATPIHQAR